MVAVEQRRPVSVVGLSMVGHEDPQAPPRAHIDAGSTVLSGRVVVVTHVNGCPSPTMTERHTRPWVAVTPQTPGLGTLIAEVRGLT